MLRLWMRDNNSIAWYKLSLCSISKEFLLSDNRSPYKALFGKDPKTGLTSRHLPANLISQLKTEEDLEKLLEKQKFKDHGSDINNEFINVLKKPLVPQEHELPASSADGQKSRVLMCHVCNKESSGAHSCWKCKQVIHAICGEADEKDEGYESQLT